MKTQDRLEGTPKSFRIRAENIPAHGLEIKETLGVTFVESLLKEPDDEVNWKVLSDTAILCQIKHEADMLLLTGGGVFQVLHPCVRCAEDVEIDVQIEFHSRLLPIENDPDHGRELDQEAFDDAVAAALEGSSETVASYYKEGIIDFSDLLREQLFLEFPLYPCCDGPESKNPKECDASALEALNVPDADIIEHPFAKLKDWKRHDV